MFVDEESKYKIQDIRRAFIAHSYCAHAYKHEPIVRLKGEQIMFGKWTMFATSSVLQLTH